MQQRSHRAVRITAFIVMAASAALMGPQLVKAATAHPTGCVSYEWRNYSTHRCCTETTCCWGQWDGDEQVSSGCYAND